MQVGVGGEAEVVDAVQEGDRFVADEIGGIDGGENETGERKRPGIER